MTREIRKDLNKATDLYKAGKRQEAFEIYDKHYLTSPDVFKHWDKIRYCWCMYYLFIKDSHDETEIVDYTERVTEIVKQEDLNESPVCVYTQCIFKVIMFLKSQDDWEYMIYWLDKLNPELLSDNEKESSNTKFPSKKEDYYRYLSKAYIECGDYQDCIDTSIKALETLTSFAFNGDIWHKWRIGKSYNLLEEWDDALTYLYDVVKVQRDWYVLKEIAEANYNIVETDEALKYAREAVLTDDPAKIKVNLYYLIYKILKEIDSDAAVMHAKLYLALKLESGAPIVSEIEDLNIDEDDLDIIELESDIKNYWSN